MWLFLNGSERISGGRVSRLEFREEGGFARQSGDRQADGNYLNRQVEA